MKILLVSDTHNSTRELEQIMERHEGEVRVVCHMGDHFRDLLLLSPKFPGVELVAVSGNCDYGGDRLRILEFSPCLDSKDAITRILIVHGDKHGVKYGLDRLAYAAKEANANAAFYGHTHFPLVTTHGGIFIMNPGSPSFPRGGSKASYGIAEIAPDGSISGRIVAV
ncbi:MAG: YfcE family phosphodiesterase [Defluviitaleaceae bacterium]|nr:YfcE family phosphodiesterase [Defluviitaleaceae bacterium]